MESLALKKVVSSANKIEATELMKNGRSFIKIRKNKGPKTLPCGTPSFIEHFSETVWPIFVCCVLSEK